MEVGMALAIKTLAGDFQPLPEVYKSFIDEALIAEDLGFDYISTSEHHFEDDAWSPSQLPILANIAARTSRIRLHTNVFLLPLHQPLRVAEDASTVDILSNGRLDLVCGTGSVEEEFVAFGVDPKTRWSRFWEEMEILRLATAPEPFTFEGKHFSIPRPIRQTTQPVQQPFPLWVGGLGSKLQYNSGLRGFHSQGGPVFRPEYLEGLKEAGVDPMTRNLSMFVSGHLAETKSKAWDECKVGWWNWQNEYRKRTWIAMLDSPMKAVPPLQPLEQLDNPPDGFMSPLLGTPDDILGALVPMLEGSQCTHFSFAFRASGGGMPNELVRPGIELFTMEVVPVLKKLGREPVTSKAVG